MSDKRSRNEIVAFAFGKVFAIFLLTCGLLSTAQRVGIVTPYGFIAMLIEVYQSVVYFILSPLSWIKFRWFEITETEQMAISLVLVITGGFSAWLNPKIVRICFFLIGALITGLVFGTIVDDIDGLDLLALSLFIPFAPIFLFFMILNGIKIDFPFHVPILSDILEQIRAYADEIEYLGILTVRIHSDGISYHFRRDLITFRMIIEYFATVGAVLFVIFSIFLSGLVTLSFSV